MSVALARRFKQDVSVDGTTWVPLGARTDFAPTETGTEQSVANYDNAGFDSFEKTMTTWQVVSKFIMPTTANVPSDPGQAILQNTRYQFGDAARTYTRWYDIYGSPDAWSGRALINWAQSKTTTPDVAEITCTFKGDGILTRITNPYVSASAPIITSATPSGAAAAAQVTIYGAGFLGTVATTGVKFGGVNATTWTVLSDTVIVATVPTGTAGSAPIIVTNATGASAAFPYTRS